MPKRLNIKRFTLFDFILIILVIFVGGFLLFYFMRKREMVFVDLTFQRQDWNESPFPPEYWQISKIERGDVSYNSVGKKVARVIEIEKNVWDGGRRMYVEMSVQLDAVYNTTTRTYVFDGNPLLIGKKLTLQLGATEFTGVIANVYKKLDNRFDGYKMADAKISVHYRDYDPWHAESIRDFLIVNANGDVVLKTDTIKITPAEKVVVTDKGEVLLRHDPIRKDIAVTFFAPNVLCRDQSCYYNRYNTFMIGEEFWADSGKTYVRGGSVVSAKITYH